MTNEYSSDLTSELSIGSLGHHLLPGLLQAMAGSPDSHEFLQRALNAFAESSKQNPHQLVGQIKRALVAQGVKGMWRVVSDSSGEDGPDTTDLPGELLSETLDRYEPASNGTWSAAPLFADRTSDFLIAVHADQDISSQLKSYAAALATGFDLADKLGSSGQRSERLAAMLEMTVRWNQTQETGELLQTMAETSTQLMEAERATIFLVDPASSQLIGRPALGVEGGELRINKGTGVVGQVVETGQPQRVDVDIANEQAQIDRSVDQQLGFQTRSLVCVPMIDKQGETIGAFELLNKINGDRYGNFSQADQDALFELAAHAAVAIENTQYVEQLKTTQRQMVNEAADNIQMIGECQAIKDLKETIQRVAETELAVLTLGENGTGKEVVAQMIHFMSNRRDQVLVAVNCAAISETLLESELFGHEKGAFTDAHEARQGKFELADGGTLFLDEIGDMSLAGQSKLLRVLEEKVVVRVGGSQTIPVDARVIAATNQDLGQLVREKKFREDLFFRLNVVTLNLPPLRERGDDILMLGEHFLKDFCGKARRPVPRMTAAAKKKLTLHAWPGNIRELRNMMERLAYLFQGEKVDVGDLSFVMSTGASESTVPMDLPLTEATKQFQADYIQRHIKRANGNMTDAAERMGLHRSNLYRKMKQLGMETTE